MHQEKEFVEKKPVTNKFPLPTNEMSEDLPTKIMSGNLYTEPLTENLSKKARLEDLPKNLLSNDSIEHISVDGLDTKSIQIKSKNLQNKPGLQFLRHLPTETSTKGQLNSF